MNESIASLEPISLIGTWRRFGEIGPVYEVIGLADAPRGEGPLVRVVETNEEVEHRLTDLLEDPPAI